MPIHRSGPTPSYWEYMVTNVLIPEDAPPSPAVLTLAYAGLNWVEIPRYQRGISWDVEDVFEFLVSDSVLLGNVILGRFPRPAERFPHLPAEITDYAVLVDGLQRLSVGTALLALLHPLVLDKTPSRPGDAGHFAALSGYVQARAAIYQHNDGQLMVHPRRAIRDQYTALRSQLEDEIESRFDHGKSKHLADLVNATMLQKQIAVDIYFDFSDSIKLMNTFLGLNTVRVDLGPVDLLRAYIVERATSSGWSPDAVESMENDFTEVFTEKERPDPELLPFVNVILKAIREGKQAAVFPSWVSALTESEVDGFLEFVKTFKSVQGINGYFDEIRQCGAIPFAMMLAYYYRTYLGGGGMPGFLVGGNGQDVELHQLLIACYRVYLDRQIGRTRDYADRCLYGAYKSLAEVADALSNQFFSAPVSASIDDAWLKSALSRVDKTRARRVFNALLLPKKSGGFGSTTFQPLPFGAKSTHYHVDHLIPESMLLENHPGYTEGRTLRNLAPLPQNQNRVAKATSCSSKLGPGGIYENYLTGGGATAHPFCVWLVQTQAPGKGGVLDQQDLLEPNRSPEIGTERIDWIAGQLKERL